MHQASYGLILAATVTLPAAAADPPAPDAQTVTVTVMRPTFPTPMQTSILGLSITAIAVVGARVSNRNSDTMMYMVLASIAVTALMVVFSDRQYRAYYARVQEHLQREALVPEKPG